ncbi:ATP-binding protein [Amycolatopsis sp.]|uniref:ATP-binding protein n=1 Tax=Amycolatopsis sp. TaxID=37632 RepID=UPI002E06F910|nr:AAA family ATPase [Amycolatopsis sp.]
MIGEGVRESPLFGRELERKRLGELIDGVGRRGGALLVRGEAGIGKSALLKEVTALTVTSRMRVLTTVGAVSEQHLPYAGLHQLLHSIRAGIDTLPVPQRDALRAALGLAEGAVPEMYLVGLAVLNLLAEKAVDSPLVLVAEDAHWLDCASQDVLAFVARRLESEPIVLIATIRDGETSRLDDAGLPAMRIERLPDDVAAELFDTVAPGLATQVRSRLLAEAAGNPLALTELPRTVRSRDSADIVPPAALPLTARLERAFTARVAGLPADTRKSLLIAALNDGSSLTETLDATAQAIGAAVDVAVLVPAVEAGLIELAPGTLTFRHPLMRSAIPQASGVAECRQAHQALAETLSGHPDRQAWHRAAATSGAAENVAAELELAADRAQRRGGVGAAIASLEHSARLSESPDRRAERLLRAADLAVESGRRDVVERLVREVATLELSARQRALGTWLLSAFDDGMSQGAAGPRELAGLAESVAADGNVDLALRILWGAGMRCFWIEPGTAARQRIADVADKLLGDESDPRKVAISAYVAPIERGRSVMAGLRELADRTDRDPQVERFLGSAALQIGAFDLSARFSAAAVPGLRAQGRLGLLTRALAVRAWSCVRLGDLAAALPAAEEAGRLAHETHQPFMYGLARAVQAETAALRGDYEQATVLAAEAERVGLASGARPVLATVQRARGLIALGEGRYADAFADLLRVHDPGDPAYQLGLRCYTLAELTEAAVRAGQTGAMTSILDELELFAVSTPSPALHIGLRYARAVLAPDVEAEDLFKAALGADLDGWPLERGRVRLAFGEWLRRRRRVAESRPHLRAARETFDALGVLPWAERARRELRAAGEVSPRRGPDARDQLTAHELSIAQLAAEGLTNREIGQRLYLSHRTVSTHLHRIFPKLGISSRGEIEAAIRPGP